jgi:hypothetical protein
MAWGTHVHEALEAFLAKGEALPASLAHYAHLYDFPPHGYTVQAELKLGITREREPCDFFDPDAYARGVLDVVLMTPRRPEMAMLIDHKTGKVREDPSELELHALLLSTHYPRLTTIKGWYNWLAADRMGSVHDLSDVDATWVRLVRTQTSIEDAYRLGAAAFPPKQGPLCGWCPVTHCEFHP